MNAQSDGLDERVDRRALAAVALSGVELDAVNRFIFDVLLDQGPPPLNGYRMRGITREQHSKSYQSWARGGRRVWGALHQGGTGQMAALCWYQHIHRPGSREWRPSIIIRAFVRAALDAMSDKPHSTASRATDATP